MKRVKAIVLTIFIWLIISLPGYAQCAMCRATLETNVSNGSETILASNLNFGILYLFAAPYIIIATVGVFWFRNSRKSKNHS
jgi:uncharacterized membrane protein